MNDKLAAVNRFKDIKLPEGAELWRKENYAYTVAGQPFDIELFASQDDRYYAIGTPADKSRLIIYGSQIVNDELTALQQAIKKINRDALQTPIFEVGEDRE
ncbi:MAG: hypothetical protein OWT28_10540 [Firmicutes bacterium]|nr:hypothetical protein [Bacillota bacterium]